MKIKNFDQDDLSLFPQIFTMRDDTQPNKVRVLDSLEFLQNQLKTINLIHRGLPMRPHRPTSPNHDPIPKKQCPFLGACNESG